MNKKITPILLFFMVFQLNAQIPKAGKWLTNVDEAVNLAKAQNKKVLVYFSGSDWCKPCKELKNEVFETTVFQQKATADYILVNIDFPRNRRPLTKEQIRYRESIAEQYNKMGSFPLVVILNSERQLLTSIDGYKSESAAYYVDNYLK